MSWDPTLQNHLTRRELLGRAVGFAVPLKLLARQCNDAARDGPHPVLGAAGAGLPAGLAHGLAV